MEVNQYKEIFIEESREHLQNLNFLLLELEKNHKNYGILNEIFRSVHTIKSMAGSMGYTGMQNLTHHMEDVLDSLRNKRIAINEEIIDLLFRCVDAIEKYVNNVMSMGHEGNETFESIVNSLSRLHKKDSNAEAKSNMSLIKPCNLDFDQHEKNIISKAFEMNRNVFEINVVLENSCILKAARSFMVFKLLYEYGDVVKSVPDIADIEDERFDFEFTIVIITEKSEDFFIKQIKNISEIKSVQVTRVPAGNIISNYSRDGSDNTVTDNQAGLDKGFDSLTRTYKTGRTVRVDINRLDTLVNLVSELIIIKTRLEDINVNENDYRGMLGYLEKVVNNLHDAVMKVRMVPVSAIFNRFPRMIRDISKELGKQIQLHMSGVKTELDRTVIDEIGDPLIHILRNATDHGLEKAEDRIKAGKPETGNIYLRSYQDGNSVVIEVEDDGRGIDIEKVKKKIAEKGLETPETVKSMSDSEAMEFLFKPSFSTSEKVTDISGRGVGLDVVKTKIQSAGGTVEIESKPGSGTKVIIRIPLTLAIINALLVQVGSEKYAIPLSSITEVVRIKSEEIMTVRDQEVLLLRDLIIPVIRLDELLGVPQLSKNERKEKVTCVIVNKGNKLSAFAVDRLIGQQEIVIKTLNKILNRIRYVSGATLLGDGNVALILDVNSCDPKR
jgi:two-component system chemotaxis sensor kinase CheA